jgi:hypothetical protein
MTVNEVITLNAQVIVTDTAVTELPATFQLLTFMRHLTAQIWVQILAQAP